MHCGGAGAGQAAKICNNLILGISMIAISEAFMLAEKLGLSHQALFKGQRRLLLLGAVLGPGAATAPSPAWCPRAPPTARLCAGFATALMLKDLTPLSQQAAEAAGADTALGRHAVEMFRRFCIADSGGVAVDSAIIQAVRCAGAWAMRADRLPSPTARSPPGGTVPPGLRESLDQPSAFAPISCQTGCGGSMRSSSAGGRRQDPPCRPGNAHWRNSAKAPAKLLVEQEGGHVPPAHGVQDDLLLHELVADDELPGAREHLIVPAAEMARGIADDALHGTANKAGVNASGAMPGNSAGAATGTDPHPPAR